MLARGGFDMMSPIKSQRIVDCLTDLRDILKDEDVGIGLNIQDESIYFYDLSIYDQTGRRDGFVLKLEELIIS